MSAALVTILLCIGYLVFTIDKKQENFPVPVVLLLLGIGLSFVPYFNDVEVTETLIYDVFLPGLLFVSAYQFSTAALRKNASVIGLLSTVGLVLTIALVGLVIYWVGGWFFSISLAGALVIAAILAPTDPASVVSILKKSAPDKSIADIVDGESMINDGTSIVLFTVLSGLYLETASIDVLPILGEFIYVSAGGVSVGLTVGWLLSKAVHITHHRDYQVMLSIVLAYGAFQLAESFGFSGVLATVSAGIMLSWEFSHANKEDHYRESLSGFWGIVEPSLLSLLFLLIGIEATEYLEWNNWILAILILFVSIAIRFLVVGSTFKLLAGRKHEEIWKKSLLISWSGIRGSMSVFLLLQLGVMAEGDAANELISLSFSVVILSLIIQSLGIHPLSKLLESK
ncbi:Na+/H+ antiporter family protein [Planococcus antarcticus DSM 14505]|uniref:Na+/H+ antiporter family protein n=1 Tax=Planococcus antarcticus DSM 14505 TaxID=1185653 RepID=A0AA87IL18_9BACL|nr:sodium:proton antiporter [Planococcus antarcticus]EIM06112.1 Na+/H+ antiporter family protein [Planococcus antarcticus DSM 14505]